MKKLKFPLIALLIAGILTIAFYSCKKTNLSPSVTSDAKGGVANTGTQYAVPTLTCNGSSLLSIDLLVTAGSTGAPSGFTVQWMTKAAYDANGGVWPLDATLFCAGSFSGTASLSRYNLGPGEGVDVNIGDLLYDNGASTNCPGELTCGTDYVFRVFAHGDSKMNQSKFGPTTTCSTLPCTDCGKHGYGYWRNHCDQVAALAPNGLTIGGNIYTPTDLCDILNENPSPGNGLLIIAHHLISAELNLISAGIAQGTAIDFPDADSYIGNNLLPTSTNGSTAFKKASTAATLVSTLVHFNENCP